MKLSKDQEKIKNQEQNKHCNISKKPRFELEKIIRL